MLLKQNPFKIQVNPGQIRLPLSVTLIPDRRPPSPQIPNFDFLSPKSLVFSG